MLPGDVSTTIALVDMVESKVAVYADHPLRFVYYRSLSNPIPCSSARTHASDASAGETLLFVNPMGTVTVLHTAYSDCSPEGLAR